MRNTEEEFRNVLRKDSQRFGLDFGLDTDSNFARAVEDQIVLMMQELGNESVAVYRRAYPDLFCPLDNQLHRDGGHDKLASELATIPGL